VFFKAKVLCCGVSCADYNDCRISAVEERMNMTVILETSMSSAASKSC